MNYRGENFEIVDPIHPAARKVTAMNVSASDATAWPEELVGTIVAGLKDDEAVGLIPSDEAVPSVHFYMTDRISHGGNAKRYVLTKLEREGPGRFPFRARRDFTP